MKRRRFFYICNAFEKTVKQERNITSDSPAASKKVIALCQAVHHADGEAWIVSLGRGQQRGTWKWYPATIRRSGKVPIVYATFWDAPLVTHVVTAISVCILLLKLSTKHSVLVFYNYLPHYVLSLLINRGLQRRCILDLEDGYRNDEKIPQRMLNRSLLALHNFLCNGGAMLASSALQVQTSSKPTYICYGVAPSIHVNKDWSHKPLQVFFGGSLLQETGAKLFLETINLLMQQHPEIFTSLRFIVTGFGDFSGQISKIAGEINGNVLVFRGNVNSVEFEEILHKSHIGLCLKLPTSSMGTTTFPSKVVELATYGLLVISTKVSDVPSIFTNDTALLLDEASPLALAQSLRRVADDYESARKIAMKGQERINNLLSSEKIGKELLNFWKGNTINQTII